MAPPVLSTVTIYYNNGEFLVNFSIPVGQSFTVLEDGIWSGGIRFWLYEGDKILRGFSEVADATVPTVPVGTTVPNTSEAAYYYYIVEGTAIDGNKLVSLDGLKAAYDETLHRTNPSGTGSFVLNPSPGFVPGAMSFTLGDGNVVGSGATGKQSFALGSSTASGQASFAVGYSFAEALATFASGTGSSARMGFPHATATSSMAVGNGMTTAGGTAAVAFGQVTEARGAVALTAGQYSIAENIGSVAIGRGLDSKPSNTFVIGVNNVIDNTTETLHGTVSWVSPISGETRSSNINKGQYIFVIGNGTSNTNRSNAMAVTWDGVIECSAIKIGNVVLTGERLIQLFDNAGIPYNVSGGAGK